MAQALPSVYQQFAPAFEYAAPYLVITERNRHAFDTEDIFGYRMEDALVLDPQRLQNRVFLQILDRLNVLNFGPAGLDMPQWAFYDCAVMPGVVFGFAARSHVFPDWVYRAFEVPNGYQGYIPLSMHQAIPLVDRRAWLGYTISGIREVSWGVGPPGLNSLTLIMAAKGLGLSQLYSVNQWGSTKIEQFLQLGPLELLTAYTPAHTEPRTVTFRVAIDDQRLLHALAQHERHPACGAATEMLDIDDSDALIALQRDLEAGARVFVVDRVREVGARALIPLRREA